MRSLLLVVALFITALPARAQESQIHTPFGPSPTVVTFTLQGELRSAPDRLASFPLGLLERLGQERNLAKLEAGGSGQSAYVVRFGFTSVEAFRTWYTAAATQKLMEEITAASKGAPSTGLGVERPTVTARMGA